MRVGCSFSISFLFMLAHRCSFARLLFCFSVVFLQKTIHRPCCSHLSLRALSNMPFLVGMTTLQQRTANQDLVVDDNATGTPICLLLCAAFLWDPGRLVVVLGRSTNFGKLRCRYLCCCCPRRRAAGRCVWCCCTSRWCCCRAHRAGRSAAIVAARLGQIVHALFMVFFLFREGLASTI